MKYTYLLLLSSACVFHLTLPSEQYLPDNNHPLVFRKQDSSRPTPPHHDDQACAREYIQQNVSTLWMRDMGHTAIPQDERKVGKSKL